MKVDTHKRVHSVWLHFYKMQKHAKIHYNVYSWKEERGVVMETEAKEEVSGCTDNFYFLTWVMIMQVCYLLFSWALWFLHFYVCYNSSFFKRWDVLAAAPRCLTLSQWKVSLVMKPTLSLDRFIKELGFPCQIPSRS